MRTNTDKTDQVWYSSKTSKNILNLNSVIAFRDVNDKWIFDDKKEMYFFQGTTDSRKQNVDFAQFACYEE